MEQNNTQLIYGLSEGNRIFRLTIRPFSSTHGFASVAIVSVFFFFYCILCFALAPILTRPECSKVRMLLPAFHFWNAAFRTTQRQSTSATCVTDDMLCRLLSQYDISILIQLNIFKSCRENVQGYVHHKNQNKSSTNRALADNNL